MCVQCVGRANINKYPADTDCDWVCRMCRIHHAPKNGVYHEQVREGQQKTLGRWCEYLVLWDDKVDVGC